MTDTCPRCGDQLEVEQVEVRKFADPEPRYVPGARHCPTCSLRSAVADLKRDLEQQEARLRREMPHCEPHEVLDSGGRSILLDARAAYVNGLAALVARPRYVVTLPDWTTPEQTARFAEVMDRTEMP